ncbi:transposase, MuDR, MULE transposase domain protein [Tanacetum coccineum]
MYTIPSPYFMKLLGFNNQDEPIVEAATCHCRGHSVQVYNPESDSFNNVTQILGNAGSFYVGVKKLTIKVEENVVHVSSSSSSKPLDIDLNESMSLDQDMNVYVSYKRAWKAKQLALTANYGCPIESFSELPIYCHNLKLANEDSVTHIKTDAEGHFKMCFIAFGFSLKSFLCYMRSLIIIDAAHLKGTYQGTNLVAVGMDGNNQIIPIATGVSQGETGESWTWFLSKLKDCIGEVPNLAIISDRHYAIILACKTVFPNSFHGFCCRHLMMNCGMQSERYKVLYWKTCKAYTEQEFDKLMSDIQAVRPDAHHKLVEAGIEKWSRAKCLANRYNYMTSNSAESVNALTKEVRKIPITALIDWYRDHLRKWYYERREKQEDLQDKELTPWASAKIRYRMLKSSNWCVNGVLRYNIYEVRDNKMIHMVYLEKGECTCRRWQLSGLPCGHVYAIARVEALTNVNNLAKLWFLNSTIKATYEGIIYPIKDIPTWQTPNDLQVVLPPVMGNKLPGRPKNKDRI